MRKNLFLPLLFAVILFLMIRLTNDLPTRVHYLSHSWRFIAIELTGVVAGSFVCDYLARKWISITISRNIGLLSEYGVVIMVPTVMCISVMAMSHDVSLAKELPDLIIPIVITVLMSIWLYLTLKSRFLNKLYAESRLKLLRAQFHPHFLFNMLNTIYFTIDEKNVKARDTVENLSNLLRSQLYEGDRKVTVEREVSALNSYLELCRMRFGFSIEIISKIDLRKGWEEIHPHLLLPLVENAVKHSGGNPRRVTVRLMQDKDSIELFVENTVSLNNVDSNDESGLGLSNLRMMLQFLYTNKYELMTEKSDNHFKAYLKIVVR
ncbi:MAG: histidine kinase [Muribaculaceae bacterium]|nr:histidine kinase [Muribaculaceae bacterium]